MSTVKPVTRPTAASPTAPTPATSATPRAAVTSARATEPAVLDVSIIIPAYNEEARIEPTLRKTAALLAAQPMSWELVVVDDGSRDGTVALCERLAAELPGVRVLATSPNRGKGHAVRAGMLAARGRVRVMCDADGSMPATELPRLLAPIADGACAIAIGSRYAADATVERQPAWRRGWSRLCNLVIQKTLVPGVRDTQCGFKAFTADAARATFGRATIDGWAFDLEVLALAKRMGYVVREVGVEWKDDKRSKVNPWKDLWKVIREAVTIKRNLRRNVYGLATVT
ncbi:MAG TPA: dolichyl-phosphate beta-glucosyltransferase [Kofleriaceae bacterium]|nr:dolichyl-phosphate beta-glucosyltransferase [Kofleriaceae bacterium]